MNEVDLVRWAVNTGIGGALAVVIFVFYRRDRLDHAKRLWSWLDAAAQREDRLLAVLERVAETQTSLRAAIEANTKALDRLVDQRSRGH